MRAGAQVDHVVSDKDAKRRHFGPPFYTFEYERPSTVIRDLNPQRRTDLTDFQDAGFKRVVWAVGHDDACPVCRKLNGKVFRIPTMLGKEFPLTGFSHPNCRCFLAPIVEPKRIQATMRRKSLFIIFDVVKQQGTTEITNLPTKTVTVHGKHGSFQAKRHIRQGEEQTTEKPARPQPGVAPKPAQSQQQQPQQPQAYTPDPNKSTRKDGITDASRVGVCGSCVPPPPGVIPRLPGLSQDQKNSEHRFAMAFEHNPEAMVKAYRDRMEKGEIGDAPNIFSTDDAKLLSPDYNLPGEDDLWAWLAAKKAKSIHNMAVHQTANALAKRAFLGKLDELAKLPEGDTKRSVLVTSGGVAAGKGYALGHIKQAKAISDSVGAIWDAAGEQNGTENPWILEECEKRGIKPVFAFIDADPTETWENPKRGVIERAKKKGRIVDARLFADSYAIGAKNFAAFHQSYKDRAEFIIVQNRGKKPKLVDGVPEEALKINADELYQRCLSVVEKHSLPPELKEGATMGTRIWSQNARQGNGSGGQQGQEAGRAALGQPQGQSRQPGGLRGGQVGARP